MKRVAVVILNWNGEKFLRQFLPGVVQYSHSVADVVVIDNASTDDSVRILQRDFPAVSVIQLDKNYGFAGGYNHGLREVSNEFYVLLNSDVEVTENWIEPVIRYMDATPRMVACQPKILDFHRKEWFEYAGAAGGYIDKDAYAFCAGRVFFEFEKDNGQYKEIDLCWRLKNRGYKVGACRESKVYHYGGGTLDRQSPFKTYLNFRNNLYMLVKNYHTSNLRLKLIRRMILDGVAGIRFITEGKWSHFTAVLKAHFSFYGNMRLLQRKRRKEELCIVEPNLTGVYNQSILKYFFLKKKRRFTDLNPFDFTR